MFPRAALSVCVLVVSLAVAGCRGDGPMPVVDEETANRLTDLTRNLLSIAGGDAQARQDLADDLQVFAGDNAAASDTVIALARRVSELVAGRTLTDEQARVLAEDLWKSAAATELSGRQVETLRGEVQTHLVAIGVTEENAAEVAAQVGTLQEQVTRPRRWYEFF